MLERDRLEEIAEDIINEEESVEELLQLHQRKLTDKDLTYLIERLDLSKPKESEWERTTYIFSVGFILIAFAEVFTQFASHLRFGAFFLLFIGTISAVGAFKKAPAELDPVENALIELKYELLERKR